MLHATLRSISKTIPVLVLTSFAGTAGAATQIGEVVEVKGEVVRVMERSTKKLGVGEPIFEKDVLQTMKDSSAKIKLMDGKATAGAVLLKQNSKVKIEKPKSIEINLSEGSLLSVFNRKKEEKSEPYRVKTRTAVIGVRGTTFYAQVEKGKEDYICPCQGQVSISTKKSKELVSGVHHDFPKFVGDDGRVKETEVRQGHDDEEIASLKSLL